MSTFKRIADAAQTPRLATWELALLAEIRREMKQDNRAGMVVVRWDGWAISVHGVNSPKCLHLNSERDIVK